MPQDATTLFAQNELTAQYAAASSHYANAEPAQAVTLWAKCLDIIRDNINPQVFRTWFENIRALSWNGSTLLIQVPSQFYYEWIEEHYGALLRTVLTQILGSGAELQYEVIVDKSQDTTLEDRTITLPAFRQQAAPADARKEA